MSSAVNGVTQHPELLQLRVWLARSLIGFARLTARHSRRLVQWARGSEHLATKWLLLTAARGLISIADASAQLTDKIVMLRE
jgi:hypothetical protein